jgi:hypothetical protein
MVAGSAPSKLSSWYSKPPVVPRPMTGGRLNGRTVAVGLQAGAERLGDQGLSRIHGLLAVFKRLQHGHHEGGVAG